MTKVPPAGDIATIISGPEKAGERRWIETYGTWHAKPAGEWGVWQVRGVSTELFGRAFCGIRLPMVTEVDGQIVQAEFREYGAGRVCGVCDGHLIASLP